MSPGVISVLNVRLKVLLWHVVHKWALSQIRMCALYCRAGPAGESYAKKRCWSPIKKEQAWPGHMSSSPEGGPQGRKFQSETQEKRLGTKGLPSLNEAILVDVTQNKPSPWSFCNWTHPVINTGSLEAWESTLFRGAQTLSKWNLDFSRNDLCGWHANLPLEWRWRNMQRNEPRSSCWKQNCYLHQGRSLPGNS